MRLLLSAPQKQIFLLYVKRKLTKERTVIQYDVKCSSFKPL